MLGRVVDLTVFVYINLKKKKTRLLANNGLCVCVFFGGFFFGHVPTSLPSEKERESSYNRVFTEMLGRRTY